MTRSRICRSSGSRSRTRSPHRMMRPIILEVHGGLDEGPLELDPLGRVGIFRDMVFEGAHEVDLAVAGFAEGLAEVISFGRRHFCQGE